MNKDAQKTVRTDSGAAPVIVDLRDRVPLMTDEALASLVINARRLKESGTAKQKTAASDLLPVIETELAQRRAIKLANAPPKASRAKKKPAVVVKEEPLEEPEHQEEE